MKRISIANDIIPVGEFKSNISKWLRNIRETGHPVVITQNGKPAGVLVSPAEYDDLIHRRSFLDSVNRGLSDAESGNVYSTEELQKELKNRRSQRNRD